MSVNTLSSICAVVLLFLLFLGNNYWSDHKYKKFINRRNIKIRIYNQKCKDYIQREHSIYKKYFSKIKKLDKIKFKPIPYIRESGKLQVKDKQLARYDKLAFHVTRFRKYAISQKIKSSCHKQIKPIDVKLIHYRLLEWKLFNEEDNYR